MPVRAAMRVASQVSGTCAATSAVVTARSGITLPVPAMRTAGAVFLGGVIPLLPYRRVECLATAARAATPEHHRTAGMDGYPFLRAPLAASSFATHSARTGAPISVKSRCASRSSH